MNNPLLIPICHAVALDLSFYNAAEICAWGYEAQDRIIIRAAWYDCKKALKEAGLYDEFMKAGDYLI